MAELLYLIRKNKDQKGQTAYSGFKKGAAGFEPATSRSAVECSTTELYPPYSYNEINLY